MGQQAVALGEDVSHPFSLDFALCYNAVLYQFCRDEQRVEELTEAAIRLSTEQGFVHWLAMATILRGWVLAKRGQSEEGIARIRQGVSDNKTLHMNILLPHQLSLLAEIYGEMGQVEEGLTLLVEAMTLVENGELRY